MSSALLPSGALAASGLPPGVHVDPGSPAGKQYSIPITSARSETSGRSSGSGSASPPLFGTGITPASTGAVPVTRVASHPSAGRSPGHAASRRSPAGRAVETAHAAAPSHSAPAAPGGATRSSDLGGNAWLPLGAGGALVLVLGGGMGLALRRRI